MIHEKTVSQIFPDTVPLSIKMVGNILRILRIGKVSSYFPLPRRNAPRFLKHEKAVSNFPFFPFLLLIFSKRIFLTAQSNVSMIDELWV
jgi:hypothetical protein